VFDGEVARTELVGPPNPIVRQQLRAARAKTPRSELDKMKIAELEAREDVRVPLTVHWNRAAKTATVDLGESTIHLAEKQWSKWINLDFDINVLVRVRGMAQLHLISAGPGAAAVRLARELAAGQPAGAHLVAGVVCRRHLRTARPVPHAGLG
jgi:hypothetical protein